MTKLNLKITNKTTGDFVTVEVGRDTTEEELRKAIVEVMGHRNEDFHLSRWVEFMELTTFSILMDTHTYANYWANKLGVELNWEF